MKKLFKKIAAIVVGASIIVGGFLFGNLNFKEAIKAAFCEDGWGDSCGW